jgi:hypothetical protein
MTPTYNQSTVRATAVAIDILLSIALTTQLGESINDDVLNGSSSTHYPK